MRSFTLTSFWDAYRHLPEHVQQQARESYRFFVSDPRHPSLDFKRVSQRRPVYSVRVSIDYRALGVLDEGEYGSGLVHITSTTGFSSEYSNVNDYGLIFVRVKLWMHWWVIGKRLLRWPLQSYCEPNW